MPGLGGPHSHFQGTVRKLDFQCQVLAGLGFQEKDFTRQTEEFSGGWQMRIALAKLLLREPTILLLDEPSKQTNQFVSIGFEDSDRASLENGGIRLLAKISEKRGCFEPVEAKAAFGDERLDRRVRTILDAFFEQP